jgi:hypothetical protein
MKRQLRVRTWTAVAALVASLGLVFAMASPVRADPAQILLATYDVNGTTHIKKTGSVMTLGPAKLSSTINLDTATFTADLPIPPAEATFKVLGLLPVSATTEFIQDGQTTGTLDLTNGAITSTSKLILRLSNVKVAGIPTAVGPHCESAYPATVNLVSGPDFNAVLGGPVSGTYTIPPFAHCLLQQILINQLIPGPDNTIDLTFGVPVITVPTS